MYCNNCGTQVPDGSHFCHNCGHKLQQYGEPIKEQKQNFEQNENNETTNQHDEQKKQSAENNTQNTDWSAFQTPDKAPQNTESLNLVLNIFCGIFAIIFAYNGFSALFSSIFHLDIYGYVLRFNPIFILTLPISIISGLVYLITTLVLVVFIFKRSKENLAGLYLALTVSCVLLIVMLILRQLFNLAFFGIMSSNAFVQFILPIICLGGVFGILYALKQAPDFNGFAQNTGYKLAEAAKNVKDAFCDLISSFSSHSQTQNTQNSNQTNYQANYQTNTHQSYQNNFNQQPYFASSPLKQDRNIFVFIVLNIITCGIYGLYTIYSLANDVNIACNGDGKKTTGLLLFIIFSMITCGIYTFYWYYSIANRIAANAPRYGMNFQEDGTSVLLWMLLGSLLCGIGYFIAYHIIFKNMNALATAYNNRRF